MKSFKVLGWVALVNASLLVACGGVSKGNGSPGDAGTTGSVDAKAGQGQGGSKPGSANGGTTASMGGKGSGMEPGTGAKPGGGVAPPVQGCTDNDECPGANEGCEMCPDGRSVCHDGYCDATSGTCKRNGGFCTSVCAKDADCSASDLPCTDCGDGSAACPTTECKAGFCEVSYPGCKDFDPCKDQECGADCRSCSGGGCNATVPAYCNDAGKCQPGAPSCGQVKCQARKDCGVPTDCTQCSDGTCATFDCVKNACALDCSTSALTCKYSAECPGSSDGQCVKCPGGQCAVPACIEDTCNLVCVAQ